MAEKKKEPENTDDIPALIRATTYNITADCNSIRARLISMYL